MLRKRPRQELTLAEYVRRRNGVPMGAPGSLRNMLHRSLGAGTLAGFWQYWNPIFGFALGKYVYGPLQRILPAPLALILTFVVCGSLHDGVTTVVRGSVAFLFTPWFLLLGLGVVLGRWVGLDVSRRSWPFRASVNLIYLATCLVITLALKRIMAIP